MANGVVVPTDYKQSRTNSSRLSRSSSSTSFFLQGQAAYKNKYGFSKPENYVFKAKKGLSKNVVEQISSMKNEPEWMREFRLKALEIFLAKKMPTWGADLSAINFDEIYYYIKPIDRQAKSWDELPKDIRDTYDAIGIPEAEKKYLAGVMGQYESEAIYHSFKKQWEDKGVIFLDMDSGLRQFPDLVKQYFGKSIPAADNKFAALNSAVWSGGSMIYVPKGVSVDIPLQAYFRINAANMGQFERTLIIVDEGAYVHYVEGCTAPVYTTDSLHAAVVEIFVKKGARCRYTTIQNWSNNVYNLVTKRAFVDEDGTMEWVDGNIGCLTGDTLLYTNPDGLTRLDKIQPNETVYSFDLSMLKPIKHKVKALVDNGVRDVYEVLIEGRTLKATANHPLLVLTRNNRVGSKNIGGVSSFVLSWKQLKDIGRDDLIAHIRTLPDDGEVHTIDYSYKPGHKAATSVLTQIKIPKESSEDLMWLLGLYIGDGWVEFSKSGRPNRLGYAVPPKDRARERLEKTLFKVFGVKGKQHGPSTLRVASSILADFFVKLGFLTGSKEKVVPAWLFRLPANQKLAFIEGYVDSDGHVRPDTHQITLTSNNKQLLEQTKLLALSCGLRVYKTRHYKKFTKLPLGREIREYECYNFCVSCHDLDKIRSHRITYTEPVGFSKVSSVKHLGKERVYDIEVEGAHNFVANGVVVHNSKITMKYPSCYLRGRGARGEVLSLALAGEGQNQDAGGKLMFLAPDTSGEIISKSVSHKGGRTSYRGLVRVSHNAQRVKCNVRCDALILDDQSRSDTYPTMKVDEDNVRIGHEASVSKIDADKLFYLMSRGLSEVEATSLIVNGFIEPIVKELPLEYAVELNRLIQLNMEGAVG